MIQDGNASSTRLLLAAMLAGGLGGMAGNPAGECSLVSDFGASLDASY